MKFEQARDVITTSNVLRDQDFQRQDQGSNQRDFREI